MDTSRTLHKWNCTQLKYFLKDIWAFSSTYSTYKKVTSPLPCLPSHPSLVLTCKIFSLFWFHHIQRQSLQIPEVLLQNWVLKAVSPVKNPPKCQCMLPRRQTKHLRSTTNLFQNKTSLFPTQQSIASELLLFFSIYLLNHYSVMYQPHKNAVWELESCMRQKETLALYFNNSYGGFHIPREKNLPWKYFIAFILAITKKKGLTLLSKVL